MCVGMTREVVESDVEFAGRLLKAGYGKGVIVAALCWRGVGEQAAVRLVDDLLRGRLVRHAISIESQAVRCDDVDDDAPPDDAPRPLRARSGRFGFRRPEQDMPVDGKVFAVMIACLCATVFLTYQCMIFLNGPSPSEQGPLPFVRTDDFEKSARGLTNL